MPSTNKTPNFGLNNWSGTDKPKRTDFTEDNLRLDSLLQTHFTDTDLHFTPEDRERFEQGSYLDFIMGRVQPPKVFPCPLFRLDFLCSRWGRPCRVMTQDWSKSRLTVGLFLPTEDRRGLS